MARPEASRRLAPDAWLPGGSPLESKDMVNLGPKVKKAGNPKIANLL